MNEPFYRGFLMLRVVQMSIAEISQENYQRQLEGNWTTRCFCLALNPLF